MPIQQIMDRWLRFRWGTLLNLQGIHVSFLRLWLERHYIQTAQLGAYQGLYGKEKQNWKTSFWYTFFVSFQWLHYLPLFKWNAELQSDIQVKGKSDVYRFIFVNTPTTHLNHVSSYIWAAIFKNEAQLRVKLEQKSDKHLGTETTFFHWTR